MAFDAWANDDITMSSPANHAAAVTPSNTADLSDASRCLVIGTAGDLKVDMVSGLTVTMPSVPACILPVRVTRVYATGTTASNITALW